MLSSRKKNFLEFHPRRFWLVRQILFIEISVDEDIKMEFQDVIKLENEDVNNEINSRDWHARDDTGVLNKVRQKPCLRTYFSNWSRTIIYLTLC